MEKIIKVNLKNLDKLLWNNFQIFNKLDIYDMNIYKTLEN